jgi:hypothetical protein
MFSFLKRRITPAPFDQVAGLIVGVLLLAACTVLSVKMAPELSRTVDGILWTAVTVGWGVLAWVIGQRLVRPVGV